MQTFLARAAEYLPILAQGLKLTIAITLGSLVLSTVLGLLWALMRVSGVKVLAMTAATNSRASKTPMKRWMISIGI